MKILALSDWRVHPVEMITDLVETHRPDVVLYAGDDLHRVIPLGNHLLLKIGKYRLKLDYPDLKPLSGKQNNLFTDNFMKKIKSIDLKNNDHLKNLKTQFYYVNGNDEIMPCVDGNYYVRVHDKHIFLNSSLYVIAQTPEGKITIEPDDEITAPIETVRYADGIYAPAYPSFGKFMVQKNGEEITIFGCKCEYGLRSEIENIPSGYADIYLSHVPPLGKLDLSVRFGIEHIGSEGLFNAIDKYQPRWGICGHSHIWGGETEKIGKTLVINVSSLDREGSDGNYALIDTENWSVQMKIIENKVKHLRGVTTIRTALRKKRIEIILKEKGPVRKDMMADIERTLRELDNYETSEELDKTLEKVEALGINTKKVKERIESLKWEQPKIIRGISIDPQRHSFIDVETGLSKGSEPGRLWLIGLWNKGELKQFLYPEEKKDFFDYLKQNKITSLVSWTGYDSNSLRPELKAVNMTIKFIDACQRASNCVIWYTYQLNKLYKALLLNNHDANDLIPGNIAGLYADHLITSNRSCSYCPPKWKIIEAIKEKNRVDIFQMIEICRLLWRCDPRKRQNNV
jgi:Icc-related predicted phosphoesterase